MVPVRSHAPEKLIQVRGLIAGTALTIASQTTIIERNDIIPYVTVGKENGENIDIYYKNWGKGQPIVFSHGWPLSDSVFAVMKSTSVSVEKDSR